jgi:hypothetical protein
MKRTLIVPLSALLCAACGPQLVVPNTPEGAACWRQCQQTYYMCNASYHPPTNDVDQWAQLFLGNPCVNAQRSCLSTCPGAHWEDTRNATTSVPSSYDSSTPTGYDPNDPCHGWKDCDARPYPIAAPVPDTADPAALVADCLRPNHVPPTNLDTCMDLRGFRFNGQEWERKP